MANIDEVEIEDRGTPVRIWCDWQGYFSFNSLHRSVSIVISVPMGWSMHADPVIGAVLRNTFEILVGPKKAEAMATAGRDGFRMRKEQP